MDGMIFLIPLTIIMGIAGFLVFLWTLKTRQYEDPEGAAARILTGRDEDHPL
jgi:cbb3-type cytochrome oxidase maturation protein